MARIKITDLDNQNFNLTEEDLKRINGGIIAITPVSRHNQKWGKEFLYLSAVGDNNQHNKPLFDW